MTVNLKHAATIITTGGALVAWFAGSATSNHVVVPAQSSEPPAIEVKSAALASEIARLHEKLQPTASPRQPARNLFRFRAAPQARAVMPVARPPLPSPEAPAPPALTMRLVGMAEDPGADGPIRVAFISAEGQLFSVKDGETVMQKYRVTKISADVVELTDVNDGTVRRLALR